MTSLTSPVRWRDLQWRRGWIPGSHRGIDYGWRSAPNTAASLRLLSAGAGVVTSIFNARFENNHAENGGWGGRIVIRLNPRVQVAYAHVARNGATVGVGQQVASGQDIGLMGNTGLSFGTHLHFELYIDGVRVDPEPYFTRNLPGSSLPPVHPPPSTEPEPAPPTPQEEEDMTRRIVVRSATVNGPPNGDWTLETPGHGLDLEHFDGTNGAEPNVRRVLYSEGPSGVIHQYRGFISTNIPMIGDTWRRLWGYQNGAPHATLPRDEGYIEAQVQFSLLMGIDDVGGDDRI